MFSNHFIAEKFMFKFVKHHIRTSSHSWFHWSVVPQNNFACSGLETQSHVSELHSLSGEPAQLNQLSCFLKSHFWGSWDTCNTASLPHLPLFSVASCFCPFSLLIVCHPSTFLAPWLAPKPPWSVGALALMCAAGNLTWVTNESNILQSRT